eukprot:4791793-Pyramimonas_sp.AAC.1
MLRNQSHSARSAWRASWLTADSALDTGRATAAAVRGRLNSSRRGNSAGCNGMRGTLRREAAAAGLE